MSSTSGLKKTNNYTVYKHTSYIDNWKHKYLFPLDKKMRNAIIKRSKEYPKKVEQHDIS